MNTERSWEGDMRASRTLTRYQVGHDEWGLLETFGRKLDAFNHAIGTANKERTAITVFDALARRGAPELWTFEPGRYYPDDDIVNAAIRPTRRKVARK